MQDVTARMPFCPRCACTQPHPAHALLAALDACHLDAALALGLLDAQPCPACPRECSSGLLEARDARRVALAARQRHRDRAARLARIKAELEMARRPAPGVADRASPLPSAAADALARALAKARSRRP